MTEQTTNPLSPEITNAIVALTSLISKDSFIKLAARLSLKLGEKPTTWDYIRVIFTDFKCLIFIITELPLLSRIYKVKDTLLSEGFFSHLISNAGFKMAFEQAFKANISLINSMLENKHNLINTFTIDKLMQCIGVYFQESLAILGAFKERAELQHNLEQAIIAQNQQAINECKKALAKIDMVALSHQCIQLLQKTEGLEVFHSMNSEDSRAELAKVIVDSSLMPIDVVEKVLNSFANEDKLTTFLKGANDICEQISDEVLISIENVLVDKTLVQSKMNSELENIAKHPSCTAGAGSLINEYLTQNPTSMLAHVNLFEGNAIELSGELIKALEGVSTNHYLKLTANSCSLLAQNPEMNDVFKEDYTLQNALAMLDTNVILEGDQLLLEAVKKLLEESRLNEAKSAVELLTIILDVDKLTKGTPEERKELINLIVKSKILETENETEYQWIRRQFDLIIRRFNESKSNKLTSLPNDEFIKVQNFIKGQKKTFLQKIRDGLEDEDKAVKYKFLYNMVLFQGEIGEKRSFKLSALGKNLAMFGLIKIPGINELDKLNNFILSVNSDGVVSQKDLVDASIEVNIPLIQGIIANPKTLEHIGQFLASCTQDSTTVDQMMTRICQILTENEKFIETLSENHELVINLLKTATPLPGLLKEYGLEENFIDVFAIILKSEKKIELLKKLEQTIVHFTGGEISNMVTSMFDVINSDPELKAAVQEKHSQFSNLFIKLSKEHSRMKKFLAQQSQSHVLSNLDIVNTLLPDLLQVTFANGANDTNNIASTVSVVLQHMTIAESTSISLSGGNVQFATELEGILVQNNNLNVDVNQLENLKKQFPTLELDHLNDALKQASIDTEIATVVNQVEELFGAIEAKAILEKILKCHDLQECEIQIQEMGGVVSHSIKQAMTNMPATTWENIQQTYKAQYYCKHLDNVVQKNNCTTKQLTYLISKIATSEKTMFNQDELINLLSCDSVLSKSVAEELASQLIIANEGITLDKVVKQLTELSKRTAANDASAELKVMFSSILSSATSSIKGSLLTTEQLSSLEGIINQQEQFDIKSISDNEAIKKAEITPSLLEILMLRCGENINKDTLIKVIEKEKLLNAEAVNNKNTIIKVAKVITENIKTNPEFQKAIQAIISNRGNLNIGKLISQAVDVIFDNDKLEIDEQIFVLKQVVRPIIGQFIADAKALQAIDILLENSEALKSIISDKALRQVIDDLLGNREVSAMSAANGVLHVYDKVLRNLPLIIKFGIKVGKQYLSNDTPPKHHFMQEINILMQDARNTDKRIDTKQFTRLYGADCFSGVNLSNYDLSKSDFKDITFNNADICAVNYTQSTFINCDFSEIKLNEKTQFSGAIFDAKSLESLVAALDLLADKKLSKQILEQIQVKSELYTDSINGDVFVAVAKVYNNFILSTKNYNDNEEKIIEEYKKLKTHDLSNDQIIDVCDIKLTSLDQIIKNSHYKDTYLKLLNNKLPEIALVNKNLEVDPQDKLTMYHKLKNEKPEIIEQLSELNIKELKAGESVIIGTLIEGHLKQLANRNLPELARCINTATHLEKILELQTLKVEHNLQAVVLKIANKLFGKDWPKQPDRINDVEKLLHTILESDLKVEKLLTDPAYFPAIDEVIYKQLYKQSHYQLSSKNGYVYFNANEKLTLDSVHGNALLKLLAAQGITINEQEALKSLQLQIVLDNAGAFTARSIRSKNMTDTLLRLDAEILKYVLTMDVNQYNTCVKDYHSASVTFTDILKDNLIKEISLPGFSKETSKSIVELSAIEKFVKRCRIYNIEDKVLLEIVKTPSCRIYNIEDKVLLEITKEPSSIKLNISPIDLKSYIDFSNTISKPLISVIDEVELETIKNINSIVDCYKQKNPSSYKEPYKVIIGAYKLIKEVPQFKSLIEHSDLYDIIILALSETVQALENPITDDAYGILIKNINIISTPGSIEFMKTLQDVTKEVPSQQKDLIIKNIIAIYINPTLEKSRKLDDKTTLKAIIDFAVNTKCTREIISQVCNIAITKGTKELCNMKEQIEPIKGIERTDNDKFMDEFIQQFLARGKVMDAMQLQKIQQITSPSDYKKAIEGALTASALLEKMSNFFKNKAGLSRC